MAVNTFRFQSKLASTCIILGFAFGLFGCSVQHETHNLVASPAALVLSNTDGDLDIYLVDLTTGATRNLTMNDSDDAQASWSPDGSKIVYVHSEAGSNDLYVYDVNSGENIQITSHPGVEALPSWSPDGKSVVFASFRADGGFGISRLDLDTQQLLELVHSDQEVTQPQWSPNGKWIAFLENTDQRGANVLVVAAEGGTPRVIVDDPKAAKTAPRWTPDSNKISYVARRDKIVGLYEIDTRTGVERSVHPTESIESGLEYSPVSGQAAFLSARGNGVRLQIYLDEQPEPRRLTFTDAEESGIAWLPDESGLLFTRYTDGRFQAMYLNLATGEERLIAPDLGGVHYIPRPRPQP